MHDDVSVTADGRTVIEDLNFMFLLCDASDPKDILEEALIVEFEG